MAGQLRPTTDCPAVLSRNCCMHALQALLLAMLHFCTRPLVRAATCMVQGTKEKDSPTGHRCFWKVHLKVQNTRATSEGWLPKKLGPRCSSYGAYRTVVVIVRGQGGEGEQKGNKPRGKSEAVKGCVRRTDPRESSLGCTTPARAGCFAL